jgi:hypothetical protein
MVSHVEVISDNVNACNIRVCANDMSISPTFLHVVACLWNTQIDALRC